LEYIAHLRAEHKRSPRSAADVEFTSAKAELIRLRILEKKKVLIVAEEAYAQMDQLVGMAVGLWCTHRRSRFGGAPRHRPSRVRSAP